MRKALFLLFAGVFASFHIQAAKRQLGGAKVFRRASSRFFSKHLYTMPPASSQRKPSFLPYLSSLHKQQKQYQGQDFKKHRSFFPYFTIGIAGITAGSLYQNTEAKCICRNKKSLMRTYDKTFECRSSLLGVVQKRIEKTLEISKAFRNNYDYFKYPEIAGMGLLVELQWCLDIKIACVCELIYDFSCDTYYEFLALCEKKDYDDRLKREIRRVRNLIGPEKSNGSEIPNKDGFVAGIAGGGIAGVKGVRWLANGPETLSGEEANNYLKLYTKAVHPNASSWLPITRFRKEAIAASIGAYRFFRAWEASGNAGVAKTYNKDMKAIFAWYKKQQR